MRDIKKLDINNLTFVIFVEVKKDAVNAFSGKLLVVTNVFIVVTCILL